MEAVPKLPMISFELKVSPEMTHFGPKLKQYIAEAYREDPDNYGNEMHQLEGLRSAAVRPTSDAAGLSALNRYFCQLRAMQSRFPMAKGQPASVNFIWKDLYANMNCTSADIRFEMACILYNIGALHAQLGASEPRTSADSLKASCTHYQQAAWAFQYLKEHYPQPHGVDVSPDIMRLMQEICFAQAQECILDKSIQDTRKPSVVGSVATQVMAFYKNSLAILGPSTGTDNIHEIIGTKLYNYWHRYLSFKTSYIGSIVCLYQGMNAEEQQKMGERVAYYQHAADKLGEAKKLAKYIEPTQITVEALTFTNDVVEGKKKAAKNENEFIYHEEVPDKDLLADLKPVCLVKAIAIDFNNPEISGPDIFSRLIPMGAHEASSMYSEEKAKLLRHIVNQAEAKNTEMTEFMSSLQLDQLDVLDSEQKIPQEIVDRCAAMNAKTEIIQSLVDSMNNLAEIISDVEHSLSECKNLIQEETAKEKEYQKVIGPRPPSIVQTELSREFNKYQEAHTRTNESNQVLHKAMTLHIANLRLLAQPLDSLETKIPSIENIEGLDRDTMLEMRRVVSKAKEMQAQRSSLIQQLRADLTSDDITGALLARSTQQADEVFQQEIEKHTPKVKVIEQNLSAQENIINKLTSLYASYGESRRLLSDVLRKREALINALITSYDAYDELLGKSQKGLEFYKKLLHNVTQLLARLKSTCQVQQEERAQLLSKQSGKESPSIPPSVKTSDLSAPAPVADTFNPNHKPTLKDYLPYMKTRGYGRSVAPTAQPEALPTDAYYPESIYPTSVRPAPVGSEATTDLPQMKYPDGYVLPQTVNPYNPYANQYAPTENNPYVVPNSYAYPVPGKSGYDIPKINAENVDGYGYNTPYTPPQYSSQNMANPVTYNPYYTGTQDSATAVTDSQNPSYMPGNVNQTNMNPNTSQYNVYNDPYAANLAFQGNQMVPPNSTMPVNQAPNPEPVSSASTYCTGNQSELSANFSQMQVSVPKPEQIPQSGHFGSEYSNTYYSIHYPHVSTPNMSTYSHAPQISNTTLVPSQVPSDYNSLNYPYGCPDQTVPSNQDYSQSQPNIVSSGYNPAISAYSYSTAGYDSTVPGYPIYTNADTVSINSGSSVSTSVVPSSIADPYSLPDNAAEVLSNLASLDKPIKSHVTGEALSANYYKPIPQSYDPSSTPNASTYPNPSEQNVPQSTNVGFPDQTNVNYAQVYQNHPGYTYNPGTGSYEYNYGSQSSTFSAYNPMSQPNSDFQSVAKDPNWAAPGRYTSAGTHETVQSPSETQQQMVPQAPEQNSQIYYNNPYGYQTMQPNEMVPNAQPVSTNYGSNMNQSTYMQSGQGQNTDVTFSNNQVTTPTENVPDAPNFNQNPIGNVQNVPQNYHNDPANYQNQIGNNQNQLGNYQNPNSNYSTPDCNQTTTSHQYQSVNQSDTGYYQNQTVNYEIQPSDIKNQQTTEPSNYQNTNVSYQPTSQLPPEETPEVKPTVEPPAETKEVPEQKPPLSTLDLLSDIDFSVELPPLKPEIKVPQVSESAIKKPTFTPREEPIPRPVKVEELIERPPKKDLFSDPSLLNKYTEEVKSLQKFVDSMTSKMVGGVTLLDAKWKTFQDVQTRENMARSKTIAMQHSSGNIVTELVPFDDTRLTLKSNPNAYINASYYKQLAPWCIPLAISKCPVEEDINIFWRSVLENKIACIVCLLSEIEMQGKSYWPTAKGQSLELEKDLKVTLEEVTCTVHWTERKLTVASGKNVINVTHYQITVFPAKIVCSPLVLLADRVLSATYASMSPALIHCGAGAGRSAVLALLLATCCQLRAGQVSLCDMLDNACMTLCKHRSNVLEDTKYLADAYRTVLFYAQGVLCSGTTAFNGETVSVPTGASLLPPAAPTPATSKDKDARQKFTRESFEEMKQSPGLTSGDMKDPLNFLDPLWSLKKK